jgi:hypothetical protein
VDGEGHVPQNHALFSPLPLSVCSSLHLSTSSSQLPPAHLLTCSPAHLLACSPAHQLTCSVATDILLNDLVCLVQQCSQRERQRERDRDREKRQREETETGDRSQNNTLDMMGTMKAPLFLLALCLALCAESFLAFLQPHHMHTMNTMGFALQPLYSSPLYLERMVERKKVEVESLLRRHQEADDPLVMRMSYMASECLYNVTKVYVCMCMCMCMCMCVYMCMFVMRMSYMASEYLYNVTKVSITMHIHI